MSESIGARIRRQEREARNIVEVPLPEAANVPHRGFNPSGVGPGSASLASRDSNKSSAPVNCSCGWYAFNTTLVAKHKKRHTRHGTQGVISFR